jgi:hypothetical protein
VVGSVELNLLPSSGNWLTVLGRYFVNFILKFAAIFGLEAETFNVNTHVIAPVHWYQLQRLEYDSV